MINVPQKAAEKFSIEKEGSIKDTKNNKAILMMTINKPKVKIIKGREINLIRGLTKALTKPSTTLTFSKFIRVKSSFKPSVSLTAIKIAKTLLKICKITFIMNFINFIYLEF